MRLYTKTELIEALRAIGQLGWIENTQRQGNDGAIGNILEDLLGIEENNLPIPNAVEWELKASRANANILTTLFHMEPSPRAVRFVPQMLLPDYGWPHAKAGTKHPATERSFRMTMKATRRTDRGFGVVVDDSERKISVSFDADAVDASKHASWLADIAQKRGLGELDPQPYWGFDDLTNKAALKFPNMFHVIAERKRQDGKEYFRYLELHILSGFSRAKFIDGLRDGRVYVEFDARTGHNHGTKFRTRSIYIEDFYQDKLVSSNLTNE